MSNTIFVTGNQDKVDYLAKALDLMIDHHKLDLDEIQSSDPQVIIEHKVRQAYDILKRPVLVEDTILGFNALNGLPGPFVKFFVDAGSGLETMCRMLDGFEDRSAYALATYGYYNGKQVYFSSGRLDGTIADHPRGEGGYGWDKIFIPNGYDGLTRAELSPEDDIKSYNQTRDHEILRKFLQGIKV